MTEEQRKFWDNVDDVLLAQYLEAKAEWKLNQQKMYN
jgi:hypothetical protein